MNNNVFEGANARDLSSSQLSKEFIWTTTFERLFSNRNHIILGARGTGKTAFAKMLSLDALSRNDDQRAINIVKRKSFIATFLPLKAEFTTKINSFQGDEKYSDMFFIWSINLASCSQFLSTSYWYLKAHEKNPVKNAILTQQLSKELGKLWLGEEYNDLESLANELSNVEYRKNYSFNKLSFGFDLDKEELEIGKQFHTDLFTPLKRGIDVIKEITSSGKNSTWALCIDEAEILTDRQWSLINTQLRTRSEICFKITTMPYKHRTLKTLVGQTLNAKHDFEYIYLDRLGTQDKSQLEAEKIIQDFAISLFDKKIQNSSLKNSGVKLEYLLGQSDLTDNSSEYLPSEKVMTFIEKYCNSKTIARARDLYGRNSKKKFSDEIERKIKPLLILKDYYESTTGQAYSSPKIYSGFDLAIKCCDGNPRKMINLFNRFISAASGQTGGSFRPLNKSQQGRIIKSYSSSELDAIKAEEKGFAAAELLQSLGNYFKSELHNSLIGAEINMSFEYDIKETEVWESVKIAVDLGLLIPDLTSAGDNDSLPVKEGKFHLSGCLCPLFFLPPRRGSTLKLQTILNRIQTSSLRNSSLLDEQLGLFDEPI